METRIACLWKNHGRPLAPKFGIARGLGTIDVLGGTDGGKGGTMDTIQGLLVGWVCVCVLAGAWSLDLGLFLGSWFLIKIV